MKFSESLDAIAPALAKAQGQIEGAVKDKVNPAFRSRYADLGAVWDAIRKPLTDEGISVIQELVSEGERIGCSTMLLHSSGQYILHDTFWLTPVKHDPQGAGSCATYCRRYSLMAASGIAPIDDDGNDASGKKVVDPELKEKVEKCASLDELTKMFRGLPESSRSAMREVFASRRAAIEATKPETEAA